MPLDDGGIGVGTGSAGSVWAAGDGALVGVGEFVAAEGRDKRMGG